MGGRCDPPRAADIVDLAASRTSSSLRPRLDERKGGGDGGRGRDQRSGGRSADGDSRISAVLRLPGMASLNTQDRQGGWSVRVSVSSVAGLETLLDDMQPWLRQEGIAEPSVRVGDDVYRVGVDSTRFAKRGGR
jgi:hypothetical protein